MTIIPELAAPVTPPPSPAANAPAIQHPAWCDPVVCEIDPAGVVHHSIGVTIDVDGGYINETVGVSVSAEWCPPNGREPLGMTDGQPVVRLEADNWQGVDLTAAQAKQLAAHLLYFATATQQKPVGRPANRDNDTNSADLNARGTSKAYALRRLRKDAPDLACCSHAA